MKEQLILFETAKLAKEKGFDWKNIEILEVKSKSAFLDSTTQSLLQKWLREVHKINVYCLPTEIDESKWYHNIASSFKVYTGSYEEVLEQGLQEGLKLIP